MSNDNELYLPLAKDLFIAAQASFARVTVAHWKKTYWEDTNEIPPLYIDIARVCLEDRMAMMNQIFS